MLNFSLPVLYDGSWLMLRLPKLYVHTVNQMYLLVETVISDEEGQFNTFSIPKRF